MTEAAVNVSADCLGNVIVGIRQADTGAPAKGAKVLEIWGDIHAGSNDTPLGYFSAGSAGLEYSFHGIPAGDHTIGVNVWFDGAAQPTSPKVAFTVPDACPVSTTADTVPTSSTVDTSIAPSTTIVQITEDSVPVVTIPTEDPTTTTTVEITTEVQISRTDLVPELPATGANLLLVPGAIALVVLGAVGVKVSKWKRRG